MNLTRSRLCASPLPGHRRPLSAREFCWWLSMPLTFGMKGSSYLCSKITGGVENAVPLNKYLSQWIVSLKTRAEQSFLHLQHTRHQLSLDGFRKCVAVLTLYFDTLISWARRFSDFLGVCSSLAPVPSNFSSVNTRRLCFVFLSIKSPVVLSLLTKLWIFCLLGTLSSRNLRRNFHRHFPADLYFT
jgi:hypothetical protein